MTIIDRVCRSLLQGMKIQLDDCVYPDVEVNVKDQLFPSHRFVLAACSKFFRGLFRSGMKDGESKSVELHFPLMSVEIFSTIHRFIYSGWVEITSDNVNGLWHAANELQLDVLLEECELFLEKTITKENCVDVYLNAKALDSGKLTSLSWGMIMKEFEFLRQTDDLMNLDTDDMIGLVASDHLAVNSESQVIEAILGWMMAEDKKFERLKVIHEVLGASKICLVNTSTLLTIALNREIQRNKEILDIIKEARDYSENPSNRNNYCPAASIHRETSKQANVVLSLNPNSDKGTVCKARTRAGDWFACAFPKGYGEFNKGSMVSFGDFIYCISRTGNTKPMKFHTKTNKWSELNDLTEPGIDYSLVAVGNFIYAIGGDNGSNIERLDTLDEMNNPEDTFWEQYASLELPVTNFSLLAMENNSIIVFGKNKFSPDLAVVQRIDLHRKDCSFIMYDAPGSYQSSVCLKDRIDNFCLEQDGSLWRVIDVDGTRVEMVYVTCLWTEELLLHGATICNRELMVLATVRTAPWKERCLDLKKDSFFSKLTIFNRPGSGLVNAVMPKYLLIDKEESNNE